MAELVTVTHAITVRVEDVERVKLVVTEEVKRLLPEALIVFTDEPTKTDAEKSSPLHTKDPS